MTVQDVTAPIKKPHGGPITHSSTGSKPDSPVHPRFPKLFLALDFLCNSRATCQVIYSGIRRNTYSRCSEPLSPSDRHRTLAYRFETSHGTFLLCSRHLLRFQFERYLCFFPWVNRLMLDLVRIRPYRVFPSHPFVSTVKILKEGRQTSS